MHPQKFLAFVHHADKTTEAGVFGFEQGVEFAQGGSVGADGFPAAQPAFPRTLPFARCVLPHLTNLANPILDFDIGLPIIFQ